MARFFRRSILVFIALTQTVFAWEKLEKPKFEICRYAPSDWYQTYLETISPKHYKNKTRWPDGRLSEIFEEVEPILVRAIEDPRAQTILAMEQFNESARVLAEDGITETRPLSAQILLNKAIKNAKKASAKGNVDAQILLAFWEYLGIKEAPSLDSILADLRNLAKKGSEFAKDLYVNHRTSREWDFFLEAQKSPYPMGYPKCGNHFAEYRKTLLSNLNGDPPFFPYDRQEKRTFWNTFGQRFYLRFPSDSEHINSSFNATCVHLLSNLVRNDSPSRAIWHLMHECFPGEKQRLTSVLEEAVVDGDPTVILELAKIYLEDSDPANDQEAERLFKLNFYQQPIWSRSNLIAAYNTNLNDPVKCMDTQASLVPFWNQLSQIKGFNLPDYKFDFAGERLHDTDYNIQTGESLGKTMGYAEFVGGFQCYDRTVNVNGVDHHLIYDSDDGAILPIYFDLNDRPDFLNIKGRLYTGSSRLEPEIGLKEQSVLITGSIHIGPEHDRYHTK